MFVAGVLRELFTVFFVFLHVQNRAMTTARNIPTTEGGLPLPRRIWAMVAIAFGVTTSVINGAIVSVALPTLSVEMSISSADSVWAVNSYQLATVMSLLIFSSVGERTSYRRVYVAGLTLFAFASLGCALSANFTALVIFRALAGVGAAAVTSINTTLIRIVYPIDRLARGLSLNATIVALSSVAGPSLASAILSFASWQWLFAVNIPFAVVAALLSFGFLPDNPERGARGRLNIADCTLNALTFGLLIFSIEAFSHNSAWWIPASTLALLGIVGTIYVRRQLHATTPLLPFDLLRIPIFTLSILTSICSFTAQMLAMVSLPFILQHTADYSDVETGLLLTAWPVVIMFIAPIAGRLVERVHAGILGLSGLSIMTLGLVLLGFIDHTTSTTEIVIRLALCGAGFGIFQSPNNSIMIASAPAARSGSASGMLATARLVGQSSGAALVALIFHLADGATSAAPLFVAAGFAATGAILSASRIRLPLPEILRHK